MIQYSDLGRIQTGALSTHNQLKVFRPGLPISTHQVDRIGIYQYHPVGLELRQVGQLGTLKQIRQIHVSVNSNDF